MAAPTAEIALTYLHALAVSSPELAEAVDLYRRLVPALSRASAGIPPLTLPAETIRSKREAGVPLLAGEDLDIAAEDCRETFLTIARALCSPGQSALKPSGLEKIVATVKSRGLDPLPLLSFITSGEDRMVLETAVRSDLDPPLLAVLAENTLKAYLRAWRPELEKSVDLEHWQKNICPVCGSQPGLAEAQGVDRGRYLRCLRCGAGWPYPNLTCAFCGNDDHRTLGILFMDSEIQKYYAHTCDQCGRYIKTVITFDPTPVDLLIVEDLATLHLDRLATERGYC